MAGHRPALVRPLQTPLNQSRPLRARRQPLPSSPHRRRGRSSSAIGTATHRNHEMCLLRLRRGTATGDRPHRLPPRRRLRHQASLRLRPSSPRQQRLELRPVNSTTRQLRRTNTSKASVLHGAMPIAPRRPPLTRRQRQRSGNLPRRIRAIPRRFHRLRSLPNPRRRKLPVAASDINAVQTTRGATVDWMRRALVFCFCNVVGAGTLAPWASPFSNLSR